MNMIKYLTLTLAVVWGLSGTVSAQSFAITPSDSLSSTGYKEDMQSLMISQLNTSPDTISLKWRKVSASVPANWDATICDNYICYGSLIDSGLMSRIAPGASGYLLLHVTSHVNYGTAIVRYAVWDPTNPALKDTLTFAVHVNNTSAVTETVDINTYRIYPNPVQSAMHILSDMPEGYTYSITDVAGRLIQAGTSAGATLLSLDHIAGGIYYISISDKDNHIHTQKFIKE